MFNETQEVIDPETFPNDVDLSSWTSSAMRSIGDYMIREHPYISICNISARRSALWLLSHESWWKTIVAACNSLLIDLENDDLALSLYAELEDFFSLSNENPAELSDNEKVNLLGALSLLNEEEAAEVLKIIHSFWHEYLESGVNTDDWSRDLLWWPCWANAVID